MQCDLGSLEVVSRCRVTQGHSMSGTERVMVTWGVTRQSWRKSRVVQQQVSEGALVNVLGIFLLPFR